VGYIDGDVESVDNPAGEPFCNYWIKWEKCYTRPNGSIGKNYLQIKVKSRGKCAENTIAMCKNGHQVLIHGELEQESWTCKTTLQKNTQIVIRAIECQLL
jgi:single-stranded DNA-binding protein